MTAHERQILMRILEAHEDAPELIAQASVTLVEAGSLPTVLKLHPQGSGKVAHVENGTLPVSCIVVGTSEEVIGSIYLFVRDGLLSALEYGWYTDEMPTQWPDVEDLRLDVRPT